VRILMQAMFARDLSTTQTMCVRACRLDSSLPHLNGPGRFTAFKSLIQFCV